MSALHNIVALFLCYVFLVSAGGGYTYGTKPPPSTCVCPPGSTTGNSSTPATCTKWSIEPAEVGPDTGCTAGGGGHAFYFYVYEDFPNGIGATNWVFDDGVLAKVQISESETVLHMTGTLFPDDGGSVPVGDISIATVSGNYSAQASFTVDLWWCPITVVGDLFKWEYTNTGVCNGTQEADADAVLQGYLLCPTQAQSLIGQGFFEGLLGAVSPTTSQYNFGQLGVNGNNKNGNFGFSSWFNVFWKLDLSIPPADTKLDGDELLTLNNAFLSYLCGPPVESHACDINIDLVCPCSCKKPTKPKPKPTYNNYYYNQP